MEHSVAGRGASFHSVFVQHLARRREVFYQQPLPWYVPTNNSTASCDPGSCLRSPSTGSPSSCLFCNTSRNSTNVMTLFPRGPLNHPIALFITLFSRFRRPCRTFFPWCAWGEGELGLNTGHNPDVDSSSASAGLAQLVLPSRLSCQQILPLLLFPYTPTTPCPPIYPPLSLLLLLPPASTSRVPIPLR